MKRNVLAPQFFALVHAFAFSSTMRIMLMETFGKDVQMTLYTDSRSLYDRIVGINSKTEKRLLIDLTILRRSYKLREITDVVWIQPEENPEDALAKFPSSSVMSQLTTDNNLSISAKSLVKRSCRNQKKCNAIEEKKNVTHDRTPTIPFYLS